MPQENPQSKKKSLHRNWVLWLLAFLPAYGVYLYYQNTPLLGDAGAFAGIAQHLQHGAILYKDVWENKAPGIFFLFKFLLAISNNHPQSFHIIQLIFTWVWLAALWHFFYRLYGLRFWPVLLFTPVILSTFTQWPYYFCGHFSEEYGTYFLLLSALFLIQINPNKKSAVWGYIFAGTLSGIAFLMKEPFIIPIGLMVIFLFLRWGRNQAIYFVIGSILPYMAFILYLSIYKAWPGYIEYLKFAFAYAGGNVHKGETFLSEWRLFLERWENNWGISYYFLFVALIPIISKGFHAKNKGAWILFAAIFIGSFIFLLLGNTFYGHYFLPGIFFLQLILLFGIIYLFQLPDYIFGKWKHKRLIPIITMVLIGFYFYQPIWAALHKFAIERYALQTTENEERTLFLKKIKSAKTIFSDKQDMGRIYFYTNRVSNIIFPCPYYVYFENRDRNMRGTLNAQKLDTSFSGAKPDLMICGKTLNAGFYALGKASEIETQYPLGDSMKTADGEMVYFRFRR